MKKRILCFGDSNTWGFMPGTGYRYPDDVRWTGVLQNLLGGDYKILEDGLNGRTTVYDQDWAQARNGLKGLYYSLQSQSPLDLVVIMLGSNDLTMTTLPFVKLGLDEVVRTALGANEIIRGYQPIYPNGAKVLLIGAPAYNKLLDEDETSSAYHKYEDSLKLSDIAAQVANERGCFYLDSRPYCECPGPDDCHLSPESHQRLGKAVAEKIKEIFAD